MVLHRQQAQFDQARWKKRVLVPAWTSQLLLVLVMIALFSWRLSETMRDYEKEEKAGLSPIVEVVWEVTNIGLSLISLLSTIFEVSRFVAETLTPWTMFFTHVVKTVCAFSTLALDIVVYVQRRDGHYSLIGLVMDLALIVVILIPAIYSFRTYRRLASFENYQYTSNAKPFGYGDLERDTSYNSRPAAESPRALGSLRRSSASSSRSTNAQETPMPLESLVTSPTYYNNTRDKDFDKHMIDHALSSEFGWGASPTTSPERTDSFVGSGMVTSAKTVSRDSMGRTPSWGSSQVLFAVQETDENTGEDAPRHRGEYEDRKSLLGARERTFSQDSERKIPRIEIEEVEGPGLGRRKRTWDA